MKKVISLIIIICVLFVSNTIFAKSTKLSENMHFYDVGYYTCSGKIKNTKVAGDQNYYVTNFDLIEKRNHIKQSELPITIGAKLRVNNINNIMVYWVAVHREEGKPKTNIIKKYPVTISDSKETFLAMTINDALDYDYYAILLIITNGNNKKDRTSAAWHIRK